MLIEADANVDAKERDGQTALMNASVEGRVGVVEVLLSAKADVNAEDDQGFTALMSASLGGHADVVEVLLRNGGRRPR